MVSNERAIQILKGHIAEAEEIASIGQRTPRFQKWLADVRTSLTRIFPDSRYAQEFDSISYQAHGNAIFTPGPDDHQRSLISGIRRGIVLLMSRVTEIETFGLAAETSVAEPNVTPRPVRDADVVFVIHGRRYLNEVSEFLRALHLKPLEWSQARARCAAETRNPQPYVWQVVDWALTHAGAIVALLTPDDEARLREELHGASELPWERETMFQPRQNVLFEAGVAFGRDPGRTVMLRVGQLRPMTDLQGFHILPYDDDPGNRSQVVQALKTAGCPADTSGTAWYESGKITKLLPT